MKHLKLIFACLLMSVLSIGQAWAADDVYVELCTSWSSTMAYATAYTHDYTINDLNGGTTTMTLGVQGVYRQSNANTYFQMNKKSGYFKNTTKLPGKITKIETTWSATKGATKCYFANNAQATSSDATVTVSASTSVTYTPNNEADYYYFNIDVSTGSGSAQMTSCKVYYTTAESVSDKPTLLVDQEELSFGPVGVGDAAPAAQSFTITGSNLESDLTVSLSDGAQYDKSVSGSLSPDGDGAVSATVTITPQSDITASAGTKEATVTISGGGLEENVTVALSTEVKAKHNIIFNTNGAASIASVPVVEGVKYDITEEVSPGESCEYKTFEGWTTASNIADASQKPATVTSVTMEGADVDLYAVFSKTVGGGNGPSGSVTITTETENFPTAYGTANTFTEYTLEGKKFKIQQGYVNGTKLQWRASGNSSGTGIIYNTEVFPAKITSVVLVYDNSDTNKNFTLNVSDTENPTSGTAITPSSEGNTYTFDCSKENADYFVLANGSGAGYLTSITINYGNAGTTTYSLDAGCCTELGAIGGSISWAANGNNLVASGWNATAGGNEDGYLVKLYNSDKSQVLDSYNTGSKDIKTHTFTSLGAGTYWVSVTPTYSGAGNYCAAGDETFSAASVELSGNVIVTFKLNGGTVEGDEEKTQEVEFNKATNLTSFATLGYVAPTCKQFGGWAASQEDANAETPVVAKADGASITVTEATNLWAIWNTKTISVTDGDIATSVASHSYSEVACDGTLTITCAAAEAYKGDPTVTATGTHGTITVVSPTQVTIANVQSDIAVSIIYETPKLQYAITWMVDGAALTGQALEGVTTSVYEGSTIANLPSVADDRLACTNKFMGWSRKNFNTVPKGTGEDGYNDLFTTGAGAGAIEKAETFYAVFAKENTSGPEEHNNVISWSRSGTTDTYTDGYTFSATATSGSGYYQDGNNTTGLSLYHQTTPIFSTTPSSVTLTASIGAGSATSFTDYVYAQLLDKDGNGIGNPIQVTKTVATATGDTYTPSFDLTGITSAYGVKLYHAKESGRNIRYFSFSLSYVSGGTTYSNYVTKCAQVSVPTFSVEAGTYDAAQTVELSCETEGAAIYYTTDGETTPTSASTPYEGAITVNQSMTIKAVAILNSVASEVNSAAYVLKVKTPTINADKTEFFDKATVTLACDDANAKIYYTIGEAAEAEYAEPFEVNATTTITAVAKRTGWTNSESATQNFTKLEVLDVAGAIAAIDEVESGQNTEAKYVRGIISTDPTYDGTHKSLTYWISDDGTETDKLQVYSGKGFNGADFSAASDLLKGDEVVVYGTMKLYTNNTTSKYQFNYNNQLFERKQRVMSIALSGEYMTECNEGATFSHEGMVVTATYNYGDDADVSEDAATTWSEPDMTTAGEKTVTVSYTFDGKTVTKDYTITVNHVCASEITITKGEEANGTFALSATGAVCGDGDGAEVEVTDIAPAEGYRFKTITATAGDVDNDLKKVTGIKANATIGVEFEQIPTHQVTWNVNGDETTKTTVQEGSKPVFPATPVSCDDAVDGSKTFIGWATAAWKGKIANLNEKTVYTKASDMPAVSGVVTYYAVFAKSNEDASKLFEWEGGTSSELTALQNVSASGLGSDYAAGNAPYRVKFDTEGDYIVITTSAAIGSVAVGVKMLGGGDASDIYVQEAEDTESEFSAVETLAISGAQNAELNLKTTNAFKSDSRAVKLLFHKGSNVGVGPITIFGESTYSNYMTTCCTKLDALNLTKAMAQHTATLTWDAIAGVTEWSVSGNVKGGDAIAPANIGEIKTINEDAQMQCEISELITSTTYEFQVSATSFGEDYCTDVNAWSIEGTTDADFVITAVASNDGAYGTVEVAGEVITATVAPYCRYATAGAYTVTSGAATVVKNGDVFTVTPESNCTVQINFEPIPVSSVTMDAELALEIGDVTTLVATVAGETGANPNVNWTVKQEGSVISLDNGEITALAAGTATITATSVGDNTKSASCVVTVTEHVITPGAYDITFGNAFFGTTGLDGSLTGANLKDYSGSKKDINVEYQKGTGSNMYLKDSEIRLYSGNALVVSVPEGYNITAITGLTTNINADKGSISGTSWSGKANTVTLRHKNSTGNSALTTINVTFAAIETYAVTFAAPVGGTLAIEDEGNAITSGDKFAEDKILDVTIEPAAAYHGGTVKVVKTGVEPEEDVTESDYSNGQLTIKDYAITVSASFVPDAAISVAVADGQSEWGSVKLYDGNADEVSSGATFKPAADFMIEATPSDPEVYEFVGWAISAGSDIAFTEENAVDNDPALVAGEVSTTFTATFREKAAPYLEATKNALNFSTTAVNGNSQLTFDLTGENLAANATYEITGDDKAIFSVVSPAFPIAPEEGVIAETITVQYAPTAVSENHSATLTITSGAASVEIALSGSAALAYTAKWYVNGTEASTVTAFEGADLEFPANPASKDDCKNLTFVGWLTSTLAEASENAPQGLITETTGLKMPVNGVNYYAVFAEKEGEDVPAGYSLSNAAPAAGDQVIIARLVSETYYGLTTAATPSTSALTVSAGVVSEPANNVIWDVATAESGVYLRPTGASTGLHMNSDALKVANGDTNGDIKFSANGNGSFKGTRADDARWIVTSGANGLTCSATQANAAELYVFKYAAGSQATYSNYVTTCVLCNKVTLVKAGEDENNTFAIQVNSTDVASVKTCEGDVAVNIVANPAIGNSVSFAISGETGATYNNNVITIPQSAAGELTVTATFSQIDYTVTMAQEGDASATISGNQENKHYGDEITVTAEAVEGYAFTGWTASPEVEFADASALSTTFTMPNSDVTVTANYTLIATCRISFQVNGAEVAFAEQTQAQEYTITKTGAAVEGFTFLGWSETEYADETEVLPAMIESYTPAAGEATKNLYGIYSRLDTSDPTVGQYVRATAVAEGDFLIVCETENVAFDGSLNKLNAAGNTQAVTISNNLLNLENADSYVFTVAAVSGGYSIKSKNGIYIGCTGSSNDMKESTETAYVNTISLVDNAFAITSSGGPKLQYYKSGANSQFKYYASNQKAIALYKKNLGTTYYTSSPVEKVTITFDANGGNGGCAKAIINKGTQLTICAEAPTKAQYDFTGWKNGDDVYVAGQAYTFNADITLTAQWTEASTYTVTYDKNGGEGPADNLEGKYAGDAITLPAALAKDEFTFQGWKYNNKLYAAGASFTMPAANVEFVAQYRKASIPVDKMSMVTSASALADGMQVALGCSYVKDEQSYFAMAGDFTGTNKYMASVTDGVSLADNIATYPSSVLVLTLEQVEGGWKIAKDDTHYLNETSVKNLTWTTKALATTWTISFSGNNVLISSANGAIKYNSTDPRFTTYASGQKSIQLFGKAVVVTETASISDLGYTEGEAIIASGSNVTLTVDVPTVTPSVTAQNGATVVVNKPTTAKEVVVENGSKIVANEATTTPTVYFATTMGVTDNNGDFHGAASELGEVNNITLATGGEIIYDLTLGVDMSTPEGAAKAANQWHAFSLPFRVDALTGIYNAATGDKLTNEVDYAIMDYDGKIRANGQYGWKKFRGILEPGVFYLMTVNGDIQTFRFKATQTGAMSQSNSMNAQAYTGTSTNESDQGWNGFGNPRWIEGTFAHDVQYLDPYTYEYVTISQNETVPVGLPFFYKASSSGPVAMGDITSSAPARNKANEIKKVAVRFGNDESKDKLYISASEDALNTYEQDKDLVKMFMSQTPKVARISANAYGMKLCVVNAPMSNDQAVYDLTLYAPQAGEYTISAPSMDNAELYLTYEGNIIWNLSMSAYPMDLKKGNNEGYGLLLNAKAPQTPTGIENGGMLNGANGVQKVIIDENVFILRGGQMYDMTGKAVK